MSVLQDNNITLITDRTDRDVMYVQLLADKIVNRTISGGELSLWKGCVLKGSYNYTDMNRVLSAVDALASALQRIGYVLDMREIVIPHSPTSSSNRFEEGDIPNAVYNGNIPSTVTEDILHNIREVRDVLGVEASSFPNLPYSYDNLTVEKANNIEKTLEIIDKLYDRIGSALIYSNQITAYCGIDFYASVK